MIQRALTKTYKYFFNRYSFDKVCFGTPIHNNPDYIGRDTSDSEVWYEPIAVIEFRGTLDPSGQSEGHYICDIRDNLSNQWFRSNDANLPASISASEVSKFAYVVLFKRSE